MCSEEGCRRRRGRRQRPPRRRLEERKKRLSPRRPLRRAMELPHRRARSSPTVDRGCFEREEGGGGEGGNERRGGGGRWGCEGGGCRRGWWLRGRRCSLPWSLRRIGEWGLGTGEAARVGRLGLEALGLAGWGRVL
jgi:hypothetical protein